MKNKLISTTELATKVPFGWNAKTDLTRWVRNFIRKHEIPYRVEREKLYLIEEQQNLFWLHVEAFRKGLIR